MIETTRKRLMLFSGRSHPELGSRVAEQLGTGLGQVELKTFSDGEIYVRYLESVRGADVFVIQTCSHPINRNIMELLLMIDALKRASAKRISAVIPYCGYSRQDKKTKAREPISVRLFADCLLTAGADRILTMDLHAAQIQGFFSGPVDHLTAVPLLSSYISGKNLRDSVIVSPDAGRVNMAKRYANSLGLDMVVVHKRRTGSNVAEALTIIGDAKDKTAVLVDDMIDTAGTVKTCVDKLIEAGASGIHVCATHGILSDPARKVIDECAIEEVVVTDSLPVPEERRSEKVTVLSIAPMLAKAITSVFRDESVSELFVLNSAP